MNSRRTRIAVSIAVPALLLLLPLLVYLVDRGVANGEVPRNVSIAAIDVGGLSRDDATAVIAAYEDDLQTQKAIFVVSDTTFELDPTTVALVADVDRAIDTALRQRAGGVFSGFVPWIRGFSDPIDIELAFTIDHDAVDAKLRDWEQEAIQSPAYEGSVGISGGTITFEYPRVGDRIDIPGARALVEATLLTPNRQVTVLPLTDSVPELTAADIDEAVATLRRMVSRPILVYDQAQNNVLTIKPSEIADATTATILRESPASIDISLDAEKVAAILDPHRSDFELPPVNVGFDVDIETDEVTIVPSKNGTEIDADAMTDALLDAATSGSGSATMVYRDGAEPEYTTADAEAFGPLGLVSEFTTSTPGVNRVHNIHLMADTIDGYVVWPGEEFSINDFIGKRTEAKGYLRDGAIIGGVVSCCDDPANVGGGVSQYGTTIYNAIFFGCYEDLDHTPHSLSISRYPEGREATLGYPAPDVRFRNDSDAPVIIRNSYDGNKTITVKFYGNNGGRTCEAERSDRFNYTDPKTVYEANPAVAPGTEHVVTKGSQGWTVTVTRVMTLPDGTVIRQPFTHRYRGHVRTIEKNPCDLGEGPCPVRVPSVMWLTEADATARLSSAGFRVATTTQSTEDPNADGVVIAQSPGGSQKPGTTITITIGVYPPPSGGGDG